MDEPRLDPASKGHGWVTDAPLGCARRFPRVSVTVMEPIDPLLSIGEAARILGCSVDSLRAWEAAGTIAAERSVGGQRRFRLSEVQRVALERAS